MSLIVHHLENSRSQRLLWLLEELQLKYEIKRYTRHPETMLAPDELRAVHPLGKSPILEDDGEVYAESGAILEHVAQNHGGEHLVPDVGTQSYKRCRFWLHYAEGSLMPILLLNLVLERMRSSSAPFFVKPVIRTVAQKLDDAFVRAQTRLHLGFVEQELEAGTWLAGGHLSLADIQMSFPLEAGMKRLDKAEVKYPNIGAYLERIHSLPAYKRALERGGPYRLN